MAVSIKHHKVSAIPDSGDASLVEPSDWNAEHDTSGIQGTIALTTTGTSGAATFDGTTLNVPNYAVTGGTLTAVAVASANGLAGSSNGSSPTATLTLSTTVTGLLKGNGTAISAAVANTDYQSPITLTTTGTSGAATFVANTLNIPNYSDTGITQLTGDVTAGPGSGSQAATVVKVNGVAFSGLATGILKNTTGTGQPSIAVAADFPTLNQNTTGSAAKWTTARNLAGNSVDGSTNVAFANKFIVQGTTDAGLSGAQFLGALTTGLVKNTTTTGVLSIGVANTDYQSPVTLTTTGSSGAATFNGTTLNIPNYAGSGTVTNSANLTNIAMVIGDGGTTGVKTVAGLTTDGTSKVVLGVAGASVGSVDFKNATSGTLNLAPPTGALSGTVTLPNATDTLVGKATTDTLTNKTYDTAGTGNSFSINGLAATANTGTGSVVRATSPALVTPALGTPSSGTLTNATGYTVANLVGDTTTALGVGSIELGNASDTTISRSAAGVIAVEGVPIYSGIPITSKSAAYTLVLADAQTAIYHPTSDNNARTFTIPANSSVAYPTGTVLTFINDINTVTIAITTDTLVLGGLGSTGSRTLAAQGMATAIKVTSTRWLISGVGIT